MNKSILLPVLCCIASCNDNSKTSIKEAPPGNENVVEVKVARSCFTHVNKKDTITLNIEVDGKSVSGDLVYNFFEKDKNTGRINGKMRGDTLIAEYTFMSEGTNSVREVAFVRKGKDMVEGYGEHEEKNGRMVFRNKDSLNFDNNTRLLNVDCAVK